MIHELKTWPEYYKSLVDGSKTFELRKNDRGYAVGDTLHLREYDSLTGRYTGREMRRLVTYALSTDISGDYVVMALAPVPLPDAAPSPQFVDGYDATFWNGSYTLLREAILEHLDDCIRDDDVAEEAILVEAIETAGKRLKAASASPAAKDTP